MIPLLLLTVSLASAAPPVAAPDSADVSEAEDARAREQYRAGVTLYEEGRYEDAMAAWEEAWDLSGRPLLLFNMANAAERLGRWDDAADLLTRYRAFAPEEERETLDRRIENIAQRGAEPARVPRSTRTAPTGPTVAPLPVVLFSVGGVGLVTGSIFGARALDARAEAGALCLNDSPPVCPKDARSALSRDWSSALVADIAFGVGVGAVGGGVIALLLPRAPVRVGLSADPHGGAVSVAGIFP